MASKYAKHSPEFKETAAREVVENSRPVAEVARKLGIVEQTLGNWVKAYRVKHASEEPALSLSERTQLTELQKEVRELRMENEFLGKSVAFFAKRFR